MTRTEVKEGKIELRAACSGVFLVDSARLIAVNSQDEVMIATRKGGTAEEAEQASAEGISQQTARKLVRYIARDAHRA